MGKQGEAASPPARTSRRYIAVAMLACLVAGMAIGRYDWLPISELASALKAARKQAAIYLVGEDKYVAQTLEGQYRRSSAAAPAAEARTLDTSHLPLRLTRHPLAGSGQFAASEDLVRGALARVGDRVLVMDKLGDIFHFDDGTLRKLDYGIFPSGIRESILRRGQSLPLPQQHLLTHALRALYIAYDPARSTLYVSLQKFNAGSKHVRFNVSALPIDGSTLARKGDWRTVFESEDIPDEASFRGATGGRMVVAGDRLFFSVGDYNFGQVPEKPFELVAQRRESAFGKIYEHDLRTGKTRVKSIGHRNPQGLAVTAEGKLLDAEHGPEGGDELNVVVDGKNYGWPYRTHGTDYGTFTWPIKVRPPAAEFTEPLHAWVPSPGISPLIQVDGFHERWKGDLLAGSLKAQSLFRMRMVDDRIVFSEQIWIGHRIRDILELPGKLVLMTDDPALVVVTVDEERLRANSKLQKHVELIPALAKCLNCHHFGPTNPSHMAPSLANVMSRRIAGDTFERYSDALKNKPGVWDKDSLARFIADPNGFAPGSTMPGLGLSKKETEEVVTALGRPRYGESPSSRPR